MTDRASTPIEQGPPPASTSTPVPTTPVPKSSTPVPATPSTRHPTNAPHTPRLSNSPFPARTARTPGLATPGGTVAGCTSDESLYAIVTVHTAKCTECDKRNKDTMRRCPGCTFQVCKPCYERREKEGRGLMHGNMMTPGSGAASGSGGARTVRRKPFASTPGAKKEGAQEIMKEDGVVAKEGEVKKVAKKEKTTPTSKSSGKKRTIRKKPQVEDSATEESSDDGAFSDFASPTPSKRRRTALTSDSPTPTPPATTRATRKPLTTATHPSHRAPSSSHSESTTDTPASAGVRLGDLDVNELMQTFGVNTPENPYHSHLLSRHEPVVSNPVIEIPEIVKRGFKARPSREEILKGIQENTLKKIQEHTLKHLEAERDKAKVESYEHTVRAFAVTEAAKHQDDVTMDTDENEALFSAMREAARQWGNQTHARLSPEAQRMVRRGLDMRLDLIDAAHKAELAELMDNCAAQKLQELAQYSAPAVASTPGPANGSAQGTKVRQERLFKQS